MQADLQNRHFGNEEVKKHGLTSLLVAMGSFVFCCAPASIVAFWLAHRAHGEARQLGVPVPTTAALGRALAAVTTAITLVLYALMAFDIWRDGRMTEERRAKIAEELEAHPIDGALDEKLACLLVESHVLEDGGLGRSASRIRRVRCLGPLTVRGEEAQQEEVEIKTSSSEPSVGVACLRKTKPGWKVLTVANGPCSGFEATRPAQRSGQGETSASSLPSPSASVPGSASASPAPPR
jgi:hypothetical protein